MKKTNVVALPGYSIPTVKPVKEIVETLEQALQEAKSGKIIGIGLVKIFKEPLQSRTSFYAEQGSTPLLISGVAGMMWSLGEHMNGKDEQI
jgi:hypothetical protein